MGRESVTAEQMRRTAASRQFEPQTGIRLAVGEEAGPLPAEGRLDQRLAARVENLMLPRVLPKHRVKPAPRTAEAGSSRRTQDRHDAAGGRAHSNFELIDLFSCTTSMLLPTCGLARTTLLSCSSR